MVLVNQRHGWGKTDEALFYRFDASGKTLSYFIIQTVEAQNQTADIQIC